MSDNLEELRNKITTLTDEELIEMVTVSAGDYRQEALDFAKTELGSRGVDFSKTRDEEQADNTGAESNFDMFPTASRMGADETSCGICGGALRAGTLVADKELTVVFADNREERFLKVTACTRCGQISLLADFDTTVGP